MSAPNVNNILDSLYTLIETVKPELLQDFNTKRHSPKELFMWLEPLLNSEYSNCKKLEETMRELFFSLH